MKKTYIYSLLAALLLAVVAFFFFFPDDVQGNVLQQHDTMQGLANGQEGKAFTEATGETTREKTSFAASKSYNGKTIIICMAHITKPVITSASQLLLLRSTS